MEYEYYVESRYESNGKLHTRILTAAEAEKLSYEDGYSDMNDNGTIYVDGFSSKENAENYIASLIQ